MRSTEPGISLVLQAQDHGQGAGRLDLFEEPAWPVRESEAFRFVFEQVLKRCMAEGLIGGEGFAVEASVVRRTSRQKHHEDDDDDPAYYA
jgi:hypothetical protein